MRRHCSIGHRGRGDGRDGEDGEDEKDEKDEEDEEDEEDEKDEKDRADEGDRAGHRTPVAGPRSSFLVVKKLTTCQNFDKSEDHGIYLM